MPTAGGLRGEGERVRTAYEALVAKKGREVTVLRVAELSSVTDHFLIASGSSRLQVQALADAVQERMADAGWRALRCEGYRDGRWVCLDYGDLVVHIFQDEVRRYFDLERLWADAPRVVPPEATVAPA
jgi:ribosome-associated protein